MSIFYQIHLIKKHYILPFLFLLSWQTFIAHTSPLPKPQIYSITTPSPYINHKSSAASVQAAFLSFSLSLLAQTQTQNPFAILWYPRTRTRLRASTWIRPEWLYPDSDPSLRRLLQLMLQQQRRRRLRVRRRIRIRRSESPTLWPSRERAGPSQSTTNFSKHSNCKFQLILFLHCFFIFKIRVNY